MASDLDNLRIAVNDLSRLVAETAVAVARTGAFDRPDRDHVNSLLQKTRDSLRLAGLRGADYDLLEAQVVLANEEEAPRPLR